MAPDHRATARPDEQKRPYTEGLRFIRSSWSRLDVRQIAGCGRPAGEHCTTGSGRLRSFRRCLGCPRNF